MSRVIKVERNITERKRLEQAIVLASKELLDRDEKDDAMRDLAAFVSYALKTLYANINQSAEAWEKRGYWLKADRFRMEWEWSKHFGDALADALSNDAWELMRSISTQILDKMKDVKLPQRNTLGKPWIGARLKMPPHKT